MDSLDKKSIDSFLRVTGGLSKSSTANNNNGNDNAENNNAAAAAAGNNAVDDATNDMSRIQQAVKEGENIRLILRSNGHQFPSNNNVAAAHDNNPAYVVCLAHHAPSDQFILFTFNATTMPCQLIRYNRDGKVIESDVIKRKLAWSEIDAAALVAAVNKCQESCDYFNTASTIQLDGGDASADNMDLEEGNEDDNSYLAGECLRLVRCFGDDEEDNEEMFHSTEDEDEDKDSESEKEEYEAIRSVLLTELLNNSGEEGGGVKFQHPDPNFLRPLSRSISKELKRWRFLRDNYGAPTRPEWPELPSPSEWEKEVLSNGVGGDRMSARDKKDFDKIVLGRSAQVEKSVEHCQSVMKKMESLLLQMSEGSNSDSISSISYELGKEGVVSLTLLRYMQQDNPMKWIHYHVSFEYLEPHADQLSNDKERLVGWLEKTNTDPTSKQPSDGEDYEYSEEDGVEDIAGMLYNSWYEEDEALLGALGRVVSAVEQCLKNGEQQSFQSVFDCIKSEQAFVSSLQKKSTRVTEMNAARLVKLMNEDSLSTTNGYEEDEREEEPWLQDATSPQWTKQNLESHLSFGWDTLGSKNSSVISFVIDHKGLMTCLRDHLNALKSSEFYCRQSNHRRAKFEIWWETDVDPLVDSTLNSIEVFLEAGDLRNASIAIVCCLGVFCDGFVVGDVGSKYARDDDSQRDFNEVLTPKFQKVWRKYDALVIKVALAYFDEKLDHRQGDTHSFFNALKSGFVSAPNYASDVNWTHGRGWGFARWPRYSHPAASIFSHHGWQHPMFLSIADYSEENDKEMLLLLPKLEAPMVIKERFNLMKDQGKTREAIVLARVAGGDHECMHFLLTNGLANEAMVQASAFKNVKGLVRLSKDLVSTNPCASVLCIQAHILGAMERLDPDRRHVNEAINNLVGILRKAWFTSSAAEEQVDQCAVILSGKVPTLRLLATISLARAFLGAAKSTSDTQAILEQQHFAECGVSPLLATITITTRAKPTQQANGILLGTVIKCILHRTGLLLSGERSGVSGSLTDFQNVPEGISRKDYLDLVCFLYESAKFLIKEGCVSVFCFSLALLSSVRIGVMTGYESFALDMIGSLKNLEDRFDFEQYTSTNPLCILSTCYSALFTRFGYDSCQDMQYALLEAFLRMKVKLPESYYIIGICDEDDVYQSQVWMAIAYSKRHGIKAAACALVDHILSNQSINERAHSEARVDYVIETTLDILLRVDQTSIGDDNSVDASSTQNNIMQSFINSDKRKRVSALERNEMISAFISHVLETSPFLYSDTITKLIQIYRSIDPLVLNRGLDELDSRLSSISDLTLALSKKSSLFTTCTIMHHLHDNPYTVLELGLSWLRNALSSREGLALFDNAEKISSLHKKYDEEGNYHRIFDDICWDMKGKPKLAAKALISVLDAKILVMLENTPPSWLSNLCNEALVLCRVLDFLIEPTPERLGAFDDARSNSQLQEDQLPSFFQSNNLVSIVVDPQWSADPDFSAKNVEYCEDGDNDISILPFLDGRVAIAAEYGYVNEAANLCVMALSDDFWTKLSDRSSDDALNECTMIQARTALRACLRVIKCAISRREDLPDDFVSHSLHLVLTMNWFRACKRCSHDSPFVNKHAQKLVVSLDHVATVREISVAWNGLDGSESPFGASLSHCLNTIRCISRCIHVLEEGDFKTRTNRSDCCFYREDGPKKDNGGTSTAQEERANPRKKRKVLISTTESDFNELETYAFQLHMKEACDWCKDAIRRVGRQESD